jgi:hypothetical protein
MPASIYLQTKAFKENYEYDHKFSLKIIKYETNNTLYMQIKNVPLKDRCRRRDSFDTCNKQHNRYIYIYIFDDIHCLNIFVLN